MIIRPFPSWTVKGRWWPTMRRGSKPALATVVHHSVTRPTTSPVNDARAVERVIWNRRFTSRFSMIAYSFMIHPDGTILEGRGKTYRNGANKNDKGGVFDNSNTISICLIGDYRTNEVTDEQRRAYKQLRAELVRTGVIDRNAKQLGHSALAYTACPAGALEQLLEEPPLVIPDNPDEEEEDDMITLIDKNTQEGWVVAGNVSRKLSDVQQWLNTWDGPVRSANNMRYVVRDLYTPHDQ